MIGKCPKCEKNITAMLGHAVNISISMKSWKGINYLCPHCHTVLSTQIDPIAIKSDTVKALKKS